MNRPSNEWEAVFDKFLDEHPLPGLVFEEVCMVRYPRKCTLMFDYGTPDQKNVAYSGEGECPELVVRLMEWLVEHGCLPCLKWLDDDPDFGFQSAWTCKWFDGNLPFGFKSCGRCKTMTEAVVRAYLEAAGK